MRYRDDPRFITARFASTCPETGRAIKKGDRCAYYPRARKAYHIESQVAEQVRALQFAEACNMPDANW